MGIRISIVIGLALIATSVHAAPTTNSWAAAGSSFWDTGTDWSLDTAPSIADGFDFITNASSKVVSIDNVDTSGEADELTISNLTVAGAGSTNNTLNLTNMNAGAEIPLNILDSLIVSNGGRLEIYNSMLQTENGTFTSGSVLKFSLGANSTPIVVSNNLALAGTLNVTVGGGFAITNYTLFTYGGTLTYTGLAISPMPTNFVATVSTSTVGRVSLIVSCPTITLSPSSPLMGATLGTNYTQAITANGGTSPYTYAVTNGTVPAGLTLSSAGTLSGTPTTLGSNSFTVLAIDANGCSGSNSYSLVVNGSSGTPSFEIISILHNTNDIVITWTAAGAQTDVVQAMNGGTSGYSTNGFQNISGPIVLSGSTTTNYVDQGGATNYPSRFYRVMVQ
jgi:hypothetical protein